jgi:cation diffusion facilitator CzcD-associated flavoprotein CzcO/acetyl esterase/lipase
MSEVRETRIERPRGLAETFTAGLLRATLRTLLKPVFSPRWSIPFQRRWLEGLSRIALVPRAVRITPGEVAGVCGEWLHHGDTPAARAGHLLYLHGGAYCVGSAATHRALTSRLAQTTGLPVFVANYRLAPEHRFPAALEDALAVYRALRERGPVVVGGDSAGGGLSLSLALALREAGERLPDVLLLLSPLADMQPEHMPEEPPGEAMLSAAWAEDCARHYLGDPSSPTDPRAWMTSPLRADLRGLPPTLIQVGTDEMLHDQALALHAALIAAGVESRCEVTPGRWHVYQLHGGALRSADEAIDRLGRFTRETLDAVATPRHSEHEVVIMGGGMSGVCMGIQLQRAGMRDFVILEKQPGMGGTWWDNTYPGAHVDVPSPVYSFSFAPNPDWSRRFASAQEIQAYVQRLAAKHHLGARTRLGTCLTEARFDGSTGHWHFRTERGDTLRSRFFVCSTGPLNQPRWPDIPGLAEFAGQRLHSARWDHNVPLAGRRVAVVGTGSTASQLVAPIAAKASGLLVFQRTANWVLPRLDRPYNGLDRLLARFPPYASAVRWAWTQVLEWGRRGFDEGTVARKGMLRTARAHLERQVPDAQLRHQLVPTYPLGCKRIIYSNDFYPALGQPHVSLITAGIERITPHGIRTLDGKEHPVDVLVCATGFDTVRLLSSVEVTGLGGRTLREAWAQGPEAYHGVTVSDFPNMFLMLGPNTGTGHTSTLLFIEPEVQHAIACMQRVKKEGKRWIEVRADVMATHNQQLQQRLAGSVWTHCRSWYRMEGGRVVALFPGFTAEYVRAVRQPATQDYTLS